MVGFQNGYPSDSSLEKRGVNLLLDRVPLSGMSVPDLLLASASQTWGAGAAARLCADSSPEAAGTSGHHRVQCHALRH